MESTIYRVLFAIYLSKNAITQILTSKKIGRVSLRTHIDGIRELKERIFNHVWPDFILFILIMFGTFFSYLLSNVNK